MTKEDFNPNDGNNNADGMLAIVKEILQAINFVFPICSFSDTLFSLPLLLEFSLYAR